MEEIKRIKRDPIPQLTIKKSIEDQFKVSKAVADAVEDPETALGKRNLEKTKENLDRGWLFFKNAKSSSRSPTSSVTAGKQCWNANTTSLLDRTESRATRAV